MRTARRIDTKEMDGRVPVLALASFALGTEAYVYVGHLGALSADLGVTIAQAGLLGTVFALTCAVAAPLLSSLTAALDRRAVVVWGLVAVGALNALAALAPGLEALLALRFGCGIAAALVGPAASAAAAALAPPERRGRAMAVVLAGMTLAFLLGIPTGSLIGALGGWRATFAFAAVVALLAAAAVRLTLAAVPGGSPHGLGGLVVGLRPSVAGPLLLTCIGFAATFTVIAYIAPVALAIAGLEGAEVGGLQALIGVGSLLGIAIGARFADDGRAFLLVAASFLVSAVALSLYSILGASQADDPVRLALLGAAMVVGAAALFSRTPAIQAQLVRRAPERASVVLALNGSMVFAGQGLGAAVGALVIGSFGVSTLGFVAAGIALVGALAAIAMERALSLPRPARRPT